MDPLTHHQSQHEAPAAPSPLPPGRGEGGQPETSNQKLVIIDPGHGRNTPGKRSPCHRLYEYEFNRDIACRLAILLTSEQIPHAMLVWETIDVPLPERVRRANEIWRRNPGAFLISIHANAGGGTGWEVFTSPGQTESDTIATIFCEEAARAFPEFRIRKDLATDGDPDKEANFYILKNTLCPAILTENFFMDHPVDLEFILTDAGRQRIAQMHLFAIQKYLSSITTTGPSGRLNPS